MTDTRDFLWVSKYSPKSVDECILPQDTAGQCAEIVQSGELPNMLFSGPPGIGKTATAKALAADLGYDTLVINGSDEGRLIDTLRTKIRNFASSVSFTGARKLVILDEADYLPADTVQPALRAFMEEFSVNCSFVLTCNFPNRILEPLRSRCVNVSFKIPADARAKIASDLFHRSCEVLEKEGIEYDRKVVAQVVKNHFPDFRRVLNELQGYAVGGKIDSGILSRAQTEYDSVIKHLREKNFGEMRTWVGKQTSLDINELARVLYDRAYDIFDKDSIPQAVIDLADYQYKASFCADPEINVAAMLTSLMMNCKFK